MFRAQSEKEFSFIWKSKKLWLLQSFFRSFLPLLGVEILFYPIWERLRALKGAPLRRASPKTRVRHKKTPNSVKKNHETYAKTSGKCLEGVWEPRNLRSCVRHPKIPHIRPKKLPNPIKNIEYSQFCLESVWKVSESPETCAVASGIPKNPVIDPKKSKIGPKIWKL